MRLSKAPHTPLYKQSASKGRVLFVLALLFVLTVVALRFPIPYFFGEGVSLVSLVFFIILLLAGPLRAILFIVGMCAGYYFLMERDVGFLILAVRLVLSAISYVILKRNLLMSELAVWLVAAIPGFLFVARTGLLYAPDRLMLQFVTEISVSILSAVLADILYAYGVLPSLLLGKQAEAVRVPIRRVLLHASYTPLMVGVSLYLILSGVTGERRILDTASQTLRSAEQSLRMTVAAWSQKDLVALKLGGTLQQIRLEQVFLGLENRMPGSMVLYDPSGAVVRTVSTQTGMTPVDPTAMLSYQLDTGLEMLSQTGRSGGMPRFWQTAVFARTFSLENQLVTLLLPIQSLDAFLDQQAQLMMTAGPFVLLVLLLLIVVSRRLEVSLNHLADGTTELLRHLTERKQQAIPSSGILEVDALADNFRFMNQTLEDLFGELQTANDELVAQSEQLRRSETELFRLAHFDVLTQLPNRYYLRVQALRLQERFGQPDAEPGGFAMLLVDLDKFKPINDKYGHSVGDLVLQEISNHFRRIVGDDVDAGDFTARMGGDEFVAVLINKSREVIHDIADALVSAILAPFTVAGVVVTLACSIGISHFPEDGTEVRSLLRRADLAMYKAKERGGNCWAEHNEHTGGTP